MTTRSAFVAIVGRPNVGKSTLLNALVGERVAIVSPKPQTTRTRVTGILTEGADQFVFIDTPGLHTPKTGLSRYMVEEIKRSMGGVDVAVLVSDPRGEIHPGEEELLAQLKESRTPVILALNKIDALPQKEDMLNKIAAFSAVYDFAEIIPISARKKDGLKILTEALRKFAQAGPHCYDAELYTEQTERDLAAEFIRERLLMNLREEIPHGAAVVIEKMKSRKNSDNLTDISALIYCEKETHKGIIIGKGGETLKKSASEARTAIEELLGTRVNLTCHVKVSPGWRNRANILNEIGYISDN